MPERQGGTDERGAIAIEYERSRVANPGRLGGALPIDPSLRLVRSIWNAYFGARSRSAGYLLAQSLWLPLRRDHRLLSREGG